LGPPVCRGAEVEVAGDEAVVAGWAGLVHRGARLLHGLAGDVERLAWNRTA
jgi:hypothetical protein